MTKAEIEHFLTWLYGHVHASERDEVERSILALLKDHPDLINTHSWPEMRRMAESR